MTAALGRADLASVPAFAETKSGADDARATFVLERKDAKVTVAGTLVQLRPYYAERLRPLVDSLAAIERRVARDRSGEGAARTVSVRAPGSTSSRGGSHRRRDNDGRRRLEEDSPRDPH